MVRKYNIGDYVRWNDRAIKEARQQNWVVDNDFKWWEEMHEVTYTGIEDFGSNQQFVYLGYDPSGQPDASTYSNTDCFILVDKQKVRNTKLNTILDDKD